MLAFCPICEDHLHFNMDIIISVYTVFVTSTFVPHFFFIRYSAIFVWRSKIHLWKHTENISLLTIVLFFPPNLFRYSVKLHFFIATYINGEGTSVVCNWKIHHRQLGQRHLFLFTTFFSMEGDGVSTFPWNYFKPRTKNPSNIKCENYSRTSSSVSRVIKMGFIDNTIMISKTNFISTSIGCIPL